MPFWFSYLPAILLISLIAISFLIYCYVKAQHWTIVPVKNKNRNKNKNPSYAANVNHISLIVIIILVGGHGPEEMEQLVCFTGIYFYNPHKMNLLSLRFLAIQMRKPSWEVANDKTYPHLLYWTVNSASVMFGGEKMAPLVKFTFTKWQKYIHRHWVKNKWINFKNASMFLYNDSTGITRKTAIGTTKNFSVVERII